MALDIQSHGSGLDGHRQELVCFAVATQHRTDACKELARREWLGDVIVRTDFETDNLVDLTILCRQHDDRHGRLSADLATHFRSRKPGQHEVEQHEVGTVLFELIKRVVAVARDFDLVALASQHERQSIRERLLILNHKHASHVRRPLPGW